MFPDPQSKPNIPRLEIFNPTDEILPFRSKLVPKLIHFIEIGEDVRYSNLEIVFTNEEEIVRINSEYLDKDYITDIITFRYDEDQTNSAIEGTLYCCAVRIKEQSRELETDSEEEFLRIIAHGALHLAGYDDQTETDREKMRHLENNYLAKVLARS